VLGTTKSAEAYYNAIDPTPFKGSDLTCSPLFYEEWREYQRGERVYRINAPAALIIRKGGTTHRVVDQFGVVHCVTVNAQTVIRWSNHDKSVPVNF